MIDLFIAHAGDDADYVLDTVIPKLISSRNGNKCHTNVLLCGTEQHKEDYQKLKSKLENENSDADNFEVQYTTSSNWKSCAKKYIKQSRAILVVIGNSIGKKQDTIGYEVEYAERMGKLVLFHKISDDIKLPDFLKEKDKFTGKLRGKAQEYSIEQIRERIDNFDKGYYDIYGNDKYRDPENVKNDMSRIMDQYKMYQKTSEDLVSRRQSVSSFYISVNSALVAISGMVMGLIGYPNNLFVIVAMAIVGIILDFSWMKILEAYGSLNAAKMKLISLMESELPISLYDTEWQIMSDKMNKKRYVSFTDSEKRIPKIFVGVYGVMIIGSVIYYLIMNFCKL